MSNEKQCPVDGTCMRGGETHTHGATIVRADGHVLRKSDVDVLVPPVPRVRIIPRDGGEVVTADSTIIVRHLSDKMEERGLYALLAYIGLGPVRLAFETTTVRLPDGWYTIEPVEPADFVPDFYRCNACGNVGSNFAYDPNPKKLPPGVPPMLGVIMPSGNYTGEEQQIMEEATRAERERIEKLFAVCTCVCKCCKAGNHARCEVATVGFPCPATHAAGVVAVQDKDNGPIEELRKRWIRSHAKVISFTEPAWGYAGPMPRRVAREEFIQAQKDNPDIHTRKAMEMFGAEAKDVTPEMRQAAKVRNFYEMYGGLARMLKMNEEEAKALKDKWLASFPAVREYLEGSPKLITHDVFGNDVQEIESKPVAIPIAEIFGCACTGEPGAEYCMKCKSYDVQMMSTSAQNEWMLGVCEEELRTDLGGVSTFKAEAPFLRELRVQVDEKGYDSLTPAQIVRLYKMYDVISENEP